MALVPRMLRPAIIIRRKALASGVFGDSLVWKVVAVVLFGRSLIKKVAGKNLEVIDVTALGAGRLMTIQTIKPTSRRARRKLAKTGTAGPTVKGYRSTSRAEAAAIRELRRSEKR